MSAIDDQQLADSPDTPDLVQDEASDNGDADLFGDDDGEDIVDSKPSRTVDDEELDSGDDLDRDDRVAKTVEEDDEDEEEQRPLRFLSCEVPRINYPQGDEFYLLNMPNHLGINQTAYNPDTYEPPTLPHDGDKSRQTSTFSTAMSSMHWRYNPNDPSQLQSTARFVRWSDGSVTLQLATKPTEQYQVNTIAMRQDFKKKLPPGTQYDPSKDSLTYLAAGHQTPLIDLQLVRSLDATMKIQPSGGASDESELRLKQQLNAMHNMHDPLRAKELKEDPELARRRAEEFEKERVRAQRKRENAEERQTLKRNNVLGRGGPGGRSAGAGLTAAGLEDEMGMPISRGKKKPKGRMNRHGEIYSDDEDETMPRGRTREDEYDRNDDFLADSEEEPDQYDDDDDILDDEEDGDAAGEHRGARQKSPAKRSRREEEDSDAEGEPDDEILAGGAPQSRKKVRRVVDDEEDE